MLNVFVSIVRVRLATCMAIVPSTTVVVLVLLIAFVFWIDCFSNDLIMIVWVVSISASMLLTIRVPVVLILARSLSFWILW